MRSLLVIIDLIETWLPYGLYVVNGIAYSVNDLGIHSTTQFKTTHLYDESVKGENSGEIAVNEIVVRGLIRALETKVK